MPVEAFPAAPPRWRIERQVWGPGGREIFYRGAIRGRLELAGAALRMAPELGAER